MSARILEKSHWHAYCDSISKELSGQTVRIEISGLKLGNQIAVKTLPLFGITYEPKSDIVEIAMEGIDHIIHKPQKIFVDDSVGGLRSMEIVDADDVRQVLQLIEPLMLTDAA